MNARAVGAKEFVEPLPRKAGAREDQRLLRDLRQGDLGAVRERISRAHHEAQAIFVNVVDFQIGRFGGQRNDTDINGAVLDPLQDLVTEVAVNADVYERIAALKFRKNVRKQIEAGRFVGPEYNRALDHVATVRDELNGLVPPTKQFLRLFEKDFAVRRQLD